MLTESDSNSGKPIEPEAVVLHPDWKTETTDSVRFAELAREEPDASVLRFRGIEWTRQELALRMQGMANVLRECGMGPGMPVALWLPTGFDFLSAWLGISHAGAISTPIDRRNPPERVQKIVAHSGASVFLTDAEGVDRASGFLPKEVQVLDATGIPAAKEFVAESPAGPDDLHTLMYTSGSTGEPKGAVRTHRQQLLHTRTYCRTNQIGTGERVSLVLAPAYSSSRSDIITALMSRSILCIYDLDSDGIEGLGDWVKRERITVFHPVPTLMRAMMRYVPEDKVFHDVKMVRLSGESVRRRDIQLFNKHFPPGSFLSWALSSTEVSSLSIMRYHHGDPIPEDPVPSGIPYEEPTPLILDDDGNELPRGKVGRVVARGYTFENYYWRAPELSKKYFGHCPGDPDRKLFFTGDTGYINEDGLLVFMGRTSFLAKISGNRVDLGEVEEAIAALPGVVEAAVVCREQESGDGVLHAFVVSDGQIASEEVRRQLARKIPIYMIPAHVSFIESMPLTGSGKLNRLALIKMAPSPVQESEEIQLPSIYEIELVGLWRRLLKMPEVTQDTDFFSHGGTSLDVAVLVEDLRSRFGVNLEPAVMLEAPTPRRLAQKIESGDQVSQPWKHLVLLNSEAEGVPFFCVPAAGRMAVSLEGLARDAGKRLPVYSFQPRGLRPGELPHTTIEERARAYVSNLLEVRPRGPYFLGGRCMGGLVAVEMARELEQLGHEVPAVIILDMNPFNPPKELRLRLKYWMLIALQVAREGGYMRSVGYKLKRFTQKRILRQQNSPSEKRAVFPTERERNVINVHRAAITKYHPSRIDGRIYLVISSNRSLRMQNIRSHALWTTVARQGVSVIRLPGTHFEILTGENRRLVARLVRHIIHQHKRKR